MSEPSYRRRELTEAGWSIETTALVRPLRADAYGLNSVAFALPLEAGTTYLERVRFPVTTANLDLWFARQWGLDHRTIDRASMTWQVGPDSSATDIYDVVKSFVRSSPGHVSVDAVLNLPLPVLGSPPNAWEAIRTLGSHGPYAAVAGALAYSDHPGLAIAAGATGYFIWLVRPSAEVLREGAARLIARKVSAWGENDESLVEGPPRVSPPTEIVHEFRDEDGPASQLSIEAGETLSEADSKDEHSHRSED